MQLGRWVSVFQRKLLRPSWGYNDTVCKSKMFVSPCQTVWFHNTEDDNMKPFHCENCKFVIQFEITQWFQNIFVFFAPVFQAERETRGFLKSSIKKYYAATEKDAVTLMWDYIMANVCTTKFLYHWPLQKQKAQCKRLESVKAFKSKSHLFELQLVCWGIYEIQPNYNPTLDNII
jgi:hypothetical protein